MNTQYFLRMEPKMMREVFCKWWGYEIAATCVVTTRDHASYRHNDQVLCCNEGIYWVHWHWYSNPWETLYKNQLKSSIVYSRQAARTLKDLHKYTVNTTAHHVFNCFGKHIFLIIKISKNRIWREVRDFR